MGIWRKVLVGLFLVILGVLWWSVPARAAEETEEEDLSGMMEQYAGQLNYGEIQAIIDEITEEPGEFQFKKYVYSFITGEKSFSFLTIGSDMAEAVKNQLGENKKVLLRLVTIAILAAVLTNFTNIFKNSQVSETGFYVTYLLMFSILAASFLNACILAGKTLSQLLEFMKVLVPAYFLTIAFSTGSGTSILFYESTLILISLVDFVLIKIIIPLIQIYFVLTIANNISKEDMLSKLAELMELIITWTLKTMLGAVVGFHVIQGLIVPAVDTVKKSMWMKMAGAIPGIGNAMGSVAETVLGAGVLVKNAVGVAGLVAIVIICGIPVVRLVSYTLIYKLGTALVQPISDKRILNCMNASVKSAGLLLYAVAMGAFLFLLSIAIIAASTNGGIV